VYRQIRKISITLLFILTFICRLDVLAQRTSVLKAAAHNNATTNADVVSLTKAGLVLVLGKGRTASDTGLDAPTAFARSISNGFVIGTAGQTQGQNATDPLAGVWEGDGPSDARAQQHTVLELRSDHTYTKTLRAIIDGVNYGGTHSGTWTARGMIVDLSGYGNYPSSSRDLRSMHKVR
jgi:hypothetical protein